MRRIAVPAGLGFARVPGGMHWLGCALLCLMCRAPASSAENPSASAPSMGRVVGTVEIHYQPGGGALDRMNESMRAKKWRLNIARADDGGLGYHIKRRLTVDEGRPEPFVIELPAEAYRIAEAENRISMGTEVVRFPVEGYFEVKEGQTPYVGRLQLLVQVGKYGRPAIIRSVLDCRDTDIALLQPGDAALGAANLPTSVLRLEDGEVGPLPSFEGCTARAAAESPQSE